MRVPEIDPALSSALDRRGWWLTAETLDGIGRVSVHLDAGRGGGPLGYADLRGTLWNAWAMTRPFAAFPNDEIGYFSTFDDALRAVLAHARF